MAYHVRRQAHSQGPDPRRLRIAMVRDQIEGRGISDPAVLAAMQTTPRHLFVHEALALNAYDDTSLPIGYGQTISQPFMVARMSEALMARPGMRVLEIGSGCGYQAAVLADMGCSVIGIERMRDIYQAAARRLRNLGYNRIHLHCGDGTLGMPQAAPFERILVSAGGPDIPAPLIAQLDENGVMVIPVGGKNRQRLVRIRKNRGRIEREDLGIALFVDLIGNHGW